MLRLLILAVCSQIFIPNVATSTESGSPIRTHRLAQSRQARRVRRSESPEQGGLFFEMNRYRRFNPYSSSFKQGFLLFDTQVALNLANSIEPGSALQGRYYMSRSLSLFVKLQGVQTVGPSMVDAPIAPEADATPVEELDLDMLGPSLGGEYRMKVGFGKLWLGAELFAQTQIIDTYTRLVNKLSNASELYGKLNFSIVPGGIAFGAHAGYYTKPFTSFANTHFDTRLAMHVLSANQIDVIRYSFKFALGHGWARFMGVKGLELTGQLGGKFLSTAYSDDFGNPTNDSNFGPEFQLGVLYYFR